MKKLAYVIVLVCIAVLALMPAVNIKFQNPIDTSDGVSIGNFVTITIGPDDVYAAPAPDYTCDGAADDVQFQAAINALPATGGKLEVLGGTYVFANLTSVTRAIDNITITGVGRGSYFTGDGVTAEFICGGNNWVFKDIRTDAGGITVGATTGWQMINVDLNGTLYAYRDPSNNIVGGTMTVAALNTNGKLTAGANEIEGFNFDIDGGDISASTISGGLTWSSAQDLNSQALTNANIDSGTVDGSTIGGAATVTITDADVDGDLDISTATSLTSSSTQDIGDSKNRGYAYVSAQDDPNGPSGADSGADVFVCDGSDDGATITAAIAAASNNGTIPALVQLSAGRFDIATGSPVDFADYGHITLRGMGGQISADGGNLGTFLFLDSSATISSIIETDDNNGLRFENFSIHGNRSNNAYGSNVVTNGTFAVDANWNKGAGWSIGAGVATKAAGAATDLDQTLATTSGAFYRVDFDLTRAAGTVTLTLNGEDVKPVTTTGISYQFYFRCDSATPVLAFEADAAFAGTIDNVTCQQIQVGISWYTGEAEAHNIAVTYMNGIGIFVKGDSGSNAATPELDNVTVLHNDDPGIYFGEYVTDPILRGCEIGANGYANLYTYSFPGFQITGNHLWGVYAGGDPFTLYNWYMVGAFHGQVAGNLFEEVVRSQVLMDSSTNWIYEVAFTGNSFYGASINNDGTYNTFDTDLYDGASSKYKAITLVGNTFGDSGANDPAWHINVDWMCQNWVVSGNTFYSDGDSGNITHNEYADDCRISDNAGFDPVGLVAQGFGWAHIGYMESPTSATPSASTAYPVIGTDIIFSSTDSGNVDATITIKDPSGNTIVDYTGAEFPVENVYVPLGYTINWGAFTGAAPTVLVHCI